MAINNNNVQNVRFLRNGGVFANHDAAYAVLTGFTLTDEQDGTAILARYTSEDTVKTLVGFVYATTNKKTITIFDVEGASADVEALREEINSKLGEGVTSANTVTDQLEALSGTTADTSATTSVEGAKRYADELIDNLNYTGITTGDAVVVTNVTEADGIVSATSANVGTLKLTGYDEGTASGHVESTDTINAAVAKLQNQIDAANDDVQAKINALDYTDTAVTGSYVSEVNETDGVISVQRVALPDLTQVYEEGKPIIAISEEKGQVAASAGAINAEYVNVVDTGNLFTASTVEAVFAEIDDAYKAADDAIVGDATTSGNTLGKLEDRIEALDADAKEYHIVKTTASLPETIKERYSLVDADGNVSGDTIDIPKDSHIVSITYNGTTQKLTYNYIDASGNTQSTDVDMSQLVLETEFGSGVTVTDHVAHGVVDPNSENYLTVGAAGFKVDGINNAIKDAIEALDVAVINPGEGKYIYAIAENDGLIAASGANVSEAVLNNYAKGTAPASLDIASTDTVNQALAKLEHQIDAAEEAAKAAATVIASGSSADTTEHLEIVTTTDSTTNAKTYTFNLKDIASQTDLDTLSGKTITEITSANGSITPTTTTATDDTVSIDLATDASKIKMSGFTADVSGFTAISESSSVTDAFKAVETFILDNELVVSSALNDLEATKLENIVVNDKTGTVTDNVATVTIDGADVALSSGYQKASDVAPVATGDTVDVAIGKLEKKIDNLTSGSSTALEEEIAARKAVDGISGQTYQANTNANYISGATSLNNADVLLDTALDAVEDRMVSGATMNGSAVTKSDKSLEFTAVASTSAGTASNGEAIVITTDNNGGLTFALDTLDCGTY